MPLEAIIIFTLCSEAKYKLSSTSSVVSQIIFRLEITSAQPSFLQASIDFLYQPNFPISLPISRSLRYDIKEVSVLFSLKL